MFSVHISYLLSVIGGWCYIVSSCPEYICRNLVLVIRYYRFKIF